MKKQLLILFFSLLLLLSLLSVVSAEYDTNCCIPSYIPPGTEFVKIKLTSTCSPGYISYNSCFDSAEEPSDAFAPEAVATGCCCEDGLVRVLDGVDSNHPEYTSKFYCEQSGYYSENFETGSNCEEKCAGATGGVEDSLYVEVYGYVFGTLDGDEFPLDGAVVTSTYDPIQVETDEEGYYTLGSVPGNPIGSNEFRAIMPDGNSVGCTPAVKEIVLGDDTQINFTLSCWEQTPACDPEWVYSEWSQLCYPFSGKLYKIRTASDEASCNSIEELEPLKKLCSGSDLTGDCGNEELDQGSTEQCDGEWFLNPTSGAVVSELDCEDVSTNYQEGVISCSDTCSYDYSDCVDVCDPTVCRNQLDCQYGCEACVGNTVVCGDPCDNMAPKFMESWRNETNQDLMLNNRSVYELYEIMEGEIVPNPIMYNETTNNVYVAWSYDSQCTDDIYGYKVKICEEDGNSNVCKSNTLNEYLIPTPDSMQTWIEDVLEPETNYCYNVCVLNENGDEICAANETTLMWPCFETGDEYCMTDGHEPGLNCEYDESAEQPIPKGCHQKDFGSNTYTDLSRRPSNIDCSGKTCIETIYDLTSTPPSKGATCVTSAICGGCNGLFGIYSSYELKTKIPKVDDNGVTIPNQFRDVDCFDMQYSFLDERNKIPTPENYLGLCYQDKTRTIFDHFDSCIEVNSCYDYKSENACLNDPCYKFVNTSENLVTAGCMWEAWKFDDALGGKSDEFSMGVCKPVNVDEEKCIKCDTDAPAGFCSEDQCGLFGSCYYKDEELHDSDIRYVFDEIVNNNDRWNDAEVIPTCLHENDMACYFYDNQQDCEGEQTLNVDVVYDVEGKRIYGTNKITNSSDDFYGVGLCKWNDDFNDPDKYGCVKDADGSVLYEGLDLEDDCLNDGGVDDLECFQDNTPPKTTTIFKEGEKTSSLNGDVVPIYGVGETAIMDFPATDDVSASDKIKTFASFLNLNKCNESCVPQFIVDELGLPANYAMSDDLNAINSCYAKECNVYPQKLMQTTTPGFKPFNNLSSGEYALIYYSEDESHNLEEIKIKHMYVDNSPPQITFDEPIVDSTKINEDVYKSDVNLSFQTDENATCEAYLIDIYDLTWSFASGNIIAQGTSFETKYNNLLDGYYEFVVDCVDNYKNRNVTSIEVEVQGDMSIRNPQPRADVFSNVDGITLSIETGINATNCQFTMDPTNYSSDHTFVSLSDKQHHTYDFNQFDLTQVGTWLGSYEFSFFTACDFEDGNRTENNVGDVITFSIDNRSPKTTLQSKEDDVWTNYSEVVPYVDQRAFKLVCDDRNVLTPNLAFDCKKIEYCFGDPIYDLELFNPETDCDLGSFYAVDDLTWTDDGEGKFSVEITIDKSIGKGKHIYFRSTDAGNNIGQVQRYNTKVRDTEFKDPEFTVTQID